MQELHVENPAQLAALCEQIRNSQWLALDTEFVREKTYYPQFCLLQIANGELAASVDPLQIEDLSPLLEILFDPQIVKVFHAGRQDLEIFHNLWGRLPTPLFDTQLAATLLGHGDQVGYGNLVQLILGHQLEKGHSRTDWSRRPLSAEQLRYALDDVIYLGDLYLQLTEQLEAQGRVSWLDEDFALLANPETYAPASDTAWQRIKGRQKLRGVQLAVLQQLAAWRETRAQASNKPKRWILKDEVLADLAMRQPASLSKLEQIRGLEAGTIKRHGETLLQLIEEARQIPKEAWPKDTRRSKKLSDNQDALVDLLQCALRLIAAEHKITPTALASRKELERLVTGEQDIELLHGWRRSLAGKQLLEVVAGELAPVVEGGVISLRRTSD